MKTEKQLEKVKRIYFTTQPSKKQLENGWLMLQTMLDEKEVQPVHIYKRHTMIFLSAIVLVFAMFLGSAQLVQGALPGEPLYPIKRFSENLLVNILPNKQTRVDNRAQEIIDLTKKTIDSELLKGAVQEYKQTVIETKQEVKNSKQNEQKFRQTLEEHEKKFEEVNKQSSGSEEEIKQAINVAKEGRSDNQNSSEDRKEEIKQEDSTKEEDKSDKDEKENEKKEESKGKDD